MSGADGTPSNSAPNPFDRYEVPVCPGQSGVDAVQGLQQGEVAAARFTTALAIAGTHGALTNTDAAAGPYDLHLAASKLLNIFVSEDNGGSYPVVIALTGLVGATPAATTAAELAALLNADANFAKFFLAVNSAGTLRFTPREVSSRFKFYFTGGCAAILGGAVATAAASGSAAVGGTQPGIVVQGIVEDNLGTPIGNCDIYVSTDVAGTAATTSTVGLADGGTENLDTNRGGVTSHLKTAPDGTFSFRVADTVAEVLNVQVQVGSSTAQVAKALRPAPTVITYG